MTNSDKWGGIQENKSPLELLPTFSANFSFLPWFKNWRRVTHDIPHKEGVTTVCHAYEDFYGKKLKATYLPSILREILYFILSENSCQYCGSSYLQTHGTVMGAKIAVAFANIFMARIETKYRGRVVLNRLNSCFGNYILTMSQV